MSVVGVYSYNTVANAARAAARVAIVNQDPVAITSAKPNRPVWPLALT